MKNNSSFTRQATSADLLAVFNLIADCAVNEFNGGGSVNSRILLVTIDPVVEGEVASTQMLPQHITDYFFASAQSQAHIVPFIKDILCGNSETRERLLSQGVVPDLVVVVNESTMRPSGAKLSTSKSHENAVLVTIHKHDATVAGACRIEEDTSVCVKGELNLDKWSIITAEASATMH